MRLDRKPVLLGLLVLASACLQPSGSTAAAPEGSVEIRLDFAVEAPSGARAVQDLYDIAMRHPFRNSDHAAEMAASRSFLQTEVPKLGVDLMLHEYRATGLNILGLDWGRTQPDEWIVLGCHYDTQPNTIYGARDDGLGCGALFEMARTFSTRDWNRTLAYAFFDEEERGLIGSAAFVREFIGRENVTLVANLNFDPAGLHYPCGDAAGKFPVNVILSLAKVAGAQARPGYAELLQSVRAGLNASGVPAASVHIATKQTYAYVNAQDRYFQVPGADYESFDRVDIPSLWLGAPPLDTVGPISVWGYPNHTPLDTADLVEQRCGSRALLAQGLEVALRTTLHALAILDGAPIA